jgi:integrase
MARLVQWFGDRPAESIGPEEIEQRFAEQDWTPATFNRYRSLLSLTYRLAIRAGKVCENPARLVRHRPENNTRIRFLNQYDPLPTKIDYLKYCKNEESRLRAVIQSEYPSRMPEFDLALHTGLRRGEQYKARWDDVDWERRLLTIPRSKNGTMRHVPLNATALHALVELRSRNGGSELVCGGAKSPRHWFEPAVEAAGVRDFSWHCLRHTFASRLVMLAWTSARSPSFSVTKPWP